MDGTQRRRTPTLIAAAAALLHAATACLSANSRTFEEVAPQPPPRQIPEYKITKAELLLPACALGSWAPWSACSATCGTGTEMSVRGVDLAPGTLLDDACLRQPLLRTRICAFKACELTAQCTFGEWLSWSACSSGCGIGSQTRVRSAFASEGPCAEVTRQAQLCFRQLCPFRDPSGQRLRYSCGERMNAWNTGATLAHVAGEPTECCRICGASQICSAWSWQVDTCFLKQANGTNRDWPNALSGTLTR